ncbi:peroxiredoxin [Streptomyces sp. WMMB303]|uniref:peroxiredoxin n=1 Tax=Streptomyces sp. WMMB303 TaxID=3034154 RepID=UPI0023EC300D|nr:peroxiredoxin [Streptomyces sp. WMMB303]MDF4252208.1 peroxiredoxin [Streptomyces sp. WMMB303]
MDDLTRLPAGLPEPEDDGAADHLPGTRLPHLELPHIEGRLVALDRLGTGRTVLYAFPRAAHPRELPDGWDSVPGAAGCLQETRGFRDRHAELLTTGASRVLGLSGQDSPCQRELAERLRLPFGLLSDPVLALAGVLRMPLLEVAGRLFYRRLTLIVRAGVIEHVFHPVFPADRHAAQVLDWLRANPA